METKNLKDEYDYVAPDGSEIRLLAASDKGELCHCTLPGRKTSQAVKHKQVTEIWYCLAGKGEVWRKSSGGEEIIAFKSGISLTIEPGVHFQFRNLGDAALRLLIATIPPWPGADEAEKTFGPWS